MVQAASLNGKVVAVTRPAGQAEEAGELIRAKGGTPYYIPAIEIKPLCSVEPVKKLISELQMGKVHYTVLMSTNGAKYLFAAAEEAHQTRQLREGLSKTCVVAVGPKTAEAVTQFGVSVGLIPLNYSSEGVLEALKDVPLQGKVVRVPRTSNATPILKDALTVRGADVEEIYVYQSDLPVDDSVVSKFYSDLTLGAIDAVLFGSGLSAKNIFKMLTEKADMEQLRRVFKDKVTVVAIGPTTAEALRELQVKVDVVPADYLFDSALDALAEYWQK